MIEIIVIWRLVVHIGNAAKQKGLKKLGYQIMAVLLWLCGEFFGGMIGSAILGANDSFWLRYLAALLGAIGGAGIAFLVMHFLPSDLPVSMEQVENEQGMSALQKFGRSRWIPVLVILMAFSCLCVGFAGALIVQMRASAQQVHASNPMIGTELDTNGQISQPITDVDSDAESIYLSFYYEVPKGWQAPVTIDWLVNGNPEYSSSENLTPGQVVTKLDRKQLGLSEFPEGDYEVNVHVGYLFLTSTSFSVK